MHQKLQGALCAHTLPLSLPPLYTHTQSQGMPALLPSRLLSFHPPHPHLPPAHSFPHPIPKALGLHSRQAFYWFSPITMVAIRMSPYICIFPLQFQTLSYVPTISFAQGIKDHAFKKKRMKGRKKKIPHRRFHLQCVSQPVPLPPAHGTPGCPWCHSDFRRGV